MKTDHLRNLFEIEFRHFSKIVLQDISYFEELDERNRMKPRRTLYLYFERSYTSLNFLVNSIWAKIVFVVYLWIWASESNGLTEEVDPLGDTYRSPIVRFHLEGTFEIGPLLHLVSPTLTEFAS